MYYHLLGLLVSELSCITTDMDGCDNLLGLLTSELSCITTDRDGCDGLLQELHEHKVPVLIFSAGLGDIIERVVVQQAHMHSNIKIVSNYMDFDNQVLHFFLSPPGSVPFPIAEGCWLNHFILLA